MDVLVPLIVLGVLAYFILRYARHGSLTGAMLGGAIKRELGKVELNRSAVLSQILNVFRMEAADGEHFVALSVVSKAPLAVSMVPYRLSKTQAQELARLLQLAAV
ncbi:hypothetical protein [Lysobacter enzymogenes]|uniref:hypothetical protein n=1 Tax=Lysobacter enzymogenes TaxID=69 RepID=UPI001A95D444|nr:hypothetical protein [Lysobacter enzymogenes]QQP96423.1 hypothetical protein JHW38_25040 [Lysobacter enzymogenes]